MQPSLAPRRQLRLRVMPFYMAPLEFEKRVRHGYRVDPDHDEAFTSFFPAVIQSFAYVQIPTLFVAW